MFKAIKEFFVGKPKVEEPVVVTTEPAVTVTIDTVQPAVEEIKPETVTISLSDNMNFSIGQPDTIILTPPADNTIWPFPTAPPAEAQVKKTRVPVKQKEAVTTKKPAPAITAKTKPRKKK
jgi:hypothetical protein